VVTILVSPTRRVCVSMYTYSVCKGKCKGKGHPRTGPQGEYRCSSALSLTSALDEGGWSTPRPGHFTPGKELEAGLAIEPVWTVANKTRSHRDSITGPSSPERVALLTELSRLLYT
jgi:hypothetical protein